MPNQGEFVDEFAKNLEGDITRALQAERDHNTAVVRQMSAKITQRMAEFEANLTKAMEEGAQAEQRPQTEKD